MQRTQELWGEKSKSNPVFSTIAKENVGEIGKEIYGGKNKQGKGSQQGNRVVGQLRLLQLLYLVKGSSVLTDFPPVIF